MSSLEAAQRALANNDPAECIRHSQEELARNPQNAEALWLSAIGNLQSGRPVQARLAGRRLLELMPADADTAELWLLVAIACTQLNDTEGAWEAFSQLLEKQPVSALAQSSLARLAYARGDREAASRLATQFMAQLGALDISDRHNSMVEVGKTVYLCSLFATETLAPGWLEGALGFLDRSQPAARYKDEGYCFGLARFFELMNDHASAVVEYRAGNRQRREQSNYDVAVDLASIEVSLGQFGSGFFQENNAAATNENDPVPLFVVGMPRTGSSLVEQILGSHSRITPCGERHWLHESLREVLEEEVRAGKSRPADAPGYDKGFFGSVRQRYLNKAGLQPGTRYFTDKMPGNVYTLWLAAKAFPEARFICTRRDRLATVMSCFSTAFSSGYGFSESLQDCCQMYDATQTLVDHWLLQLPGRVIELGYERMTTSERASIDALFDSLGLAAEEACYQPHKLKRAVGTASTMQVQDPIYQDANQRWLRYLPFLAEDASLFG